MVRSRASALHAQRQFLMLVVGVLFCGMTGLTLGYVLGTQSFDEQRAFTQSQLDFIEGFERGLVFRQDYEAWSAEKDRSLNDVRSEPRTRCAGIWFDQPAHLTGCIQAVEKPPEGYHLPTR